MKLAAFFRLLGWLAVGSGAAAQCELLVASDGDFDDRFGSAVHLGGDRLFVQRKGGGFRAEDVVVFERRAATWVESARLQGSDATDGDGYGAAMGSAGEEVLVGAPVFAVGEGAVYVHERTAGGWIETQKLTPSGVAGAVDLALFGDEIAVEGARAAIGAPRENFLGALTSPGAVYVYEREPSGWVEMQRIQAPVPELDQLFGSSVALDGERLLVGAPGEGFVTGAAHVFTLSAGAWVEEAVLIPTSTVAFLGEEVALSGDIALASSSGGVVVFESTASGWLETALLPAGSSSSPIAFDGQLALVGAPLEDPAVVRVFERVGTGWVEHDPIPEPLLGTLATGFGQSLSGGTGRAATGMPGAGCEEVGSGAALLFDPLLACPPLLSVPRQVSLSAGGTHCLSLDAGPEQASELFLILGSASGTSPGQPFQGLTIPLNQDGYDLFTLLEPNAFVQPSLQFLDADGARLAKIFLPAGSSPSLAGVVLHHAFLVFDTTGGTLSTRLVSNAAPLELVP